MKTQGQYILFTRDEFKTWLGKQKISRKILLIQNHHTYIPGYANFKGNNHFAMLDGMKASHMQRGFTDIAQNLTTFPDGLIALCRPIDTAPAGIKGANANGICIEHVGNFDTGGDTMTIEHRKTILFINAILCKQFNLPVDTNHVVYHKWWDLNTGIRTNGTGTTKSCPGTNFFGGNTVEMANKNFIPLIKEALQMTLTDAVKFIDSKVQLDEALWGGTDQATKAKYIDALLIKIATAWQKEGKL